MMEPVAPCRALGIAVALVLSAGCATAPPPAPPPPLPNHDALGELDQAHRAAAAGDWETARIHLEAAVKASPTLGLAQVDLADALMHLGQEGPALADALRAGQQLEPQNPRVWKLAGAYAQDVGDPAAALRADERALALRPGDPLVTFRLAGLYASAGRVPEAVAAYHTVLALDPTHERAQLSLATLLGQQGDWAGAEAALTALCARHPQNALYQRQLQQVRVKEGKAAPTPVDTRVMRPLRKSRH